jgi:hypothetical protein
MQPANLATPAVHNFDINLPVETKGDNIKFHGVEECYIGVGLENTGEELREVMLDHCALDANLFVWDPQAGKNNVVSLATNRTIREILEGEQINIEPFRRGEKALKFILQRTEESARRALNTKSARKVDS